MQRRAPVSVFGGKGVHVEGGIGLPLLAFGKVPTVANDMAVGGQLLFREAAEVRFDPAVVWSVAFPRLVFCSL